MLGLIVSPARNELPTGLFAKRCKEQGRGGSMRVKISGVPALRLLAVAQKNELDAIA
jgi:hypothetical protein